MAGEREEFWLRVEMRPMEPGRETDPDRMAEQVRMALLQLAAAQRRMLMVEWFAPGPMARRLMYRGRLPKHN